MAATDMKFGPEWLRALSDGGTNTNTQTPPITTAPPKYKLADYRYGREEMLALFNRNCKPPETLSEFPHIFVEKIQLPLAIIPMSDDEQRLWSRPVNSDVVVRLLGKAATSGNDRERVSERGGVSIRTGRGSSLSERGSRGRGRGVYYQRGTSYDDSGDSPPERREFRVRNFERSSSITEDNGSNSREKRYERSYNRGGVVGGGVVGGNGDDSPISRKNNSRSSSVENWRTAGRGEDREGWRTASRIADNWNRSNSWRGGDREREFDHDNDHQQRNGPHNPHRKPYNNYHKDKNDLWEDIEENDRRNSVLPEWSVDDGHECKGGTFNQFGDFIEDNNEDDEQLEDKSNKNDDEINDNDLDACDESTNARPKRSECQDIKNNSYIEHSKDLKTENINQNLEKVISHDSNEEMSIKTPQSSVKSQKQHQRQSLTSPSNTSNKSSLNQQNMKSPLEENDGFAHLEKEAENMVAMWTAEDDQKDENDLEANMKSLIVLPVNHEDAFKWFYRDPQGEIQGPFTPHEMYDWFTAGYFAMDLLVRRGCDELFSQLGELFKLWERIPFLQVQGSTPPPLRSTSSSSSSHSTLPVSLSSTPHTNSHNIHSHQQIIQQQFQHNQHKQQQQQQQHASQPQPIFMNQHIDMQSQLRQLLAQLKKQDGFCDLSQQQQQEVLVQQYVNMERQRQSLQTSIPNTRPSEDSQISSLEVLSKMRVQNARPLQIVNNSGHSGHSGHVASIWDMNSGVISVSAVEEMQLKEQERKDMEEKRKLFEDQRRKMEHEELQRKLVEDQKRKYEELQKKLEEERLKNQELLRKQEEERRKRDEEERLRLEEERNRIEEDRRIIEEQRRRQEELMRLEEYARRQQQEETERRRQLEAEKERQRKQLQDIEQQRVKDMERLRQLQQQEAIIKLQQQEQQRNRTTVWGGQQEQNQRQQQTPLSLNEIQRLQEEKDREERQRQIQIQQQQMQALFHAQQQQQQQQQQNKQSLTWATTSYQQQQNVPVKTLAEIQKEEADKLTKQKQIDQLKQIQVNNNVPNAGIWNNANNQLFGQMPVKVTNSTNSSSTVGFWEAETTRKVQPNRANDSALMLSNTKANNTALYQTKVNSRTKKDEETVLRLFENQRRQTTDEFTVWCNEVLAKFQSSVDIPTFIAFLKDVESPFEINDYVRSYLGESKEVKDFAKQFIERRSYFRNQAKKEATEELMWGPAPAITPSTNKLSQSPTTNQTVQCGESEMSGFIQAGKKKKKPKQRVIDNSILGFTVQADPERFNAGEIEQIED